MIGSINHHHHDDDNENGKTAWLVLWAKQQLCTRITLLSTFLWGPVNDYFVYGGREHITSTNFLLSFVRLNKVLQNSTPRKVAYLWQIERVQKDAIKFKRQQIKFSSDVFIAVFVKKKYVRGERHHPPPIAINPQHPSPRYIWKQRSRRSLWKILDCDFNFDCFNQGLLYSRSREKFPYSKRFQEEGVINITNNV